MPSTWLSLASSAALETPSYFYGVLAALEQLETAARSGNRAALRRFAAGKRYNASELGLTEACAPPES